MKSRRGEIDFDTSLRQRVELLKGASVDIIGVVRDKITFSDGAIELCACLKYLGYKLAVVSGNYSVSDFKCLALLYILHQGKYKSYFVKAYHILLMDQLMEGGFLPLANHVKACLNLDYAFANTLEVSEDGLTLTGNVTGSIVNGEKKAELLKVIANGESIDLKQVVLLNEGYGGRRRSE